MVAVLLNTTRAATTMDCGSTSVCGILTLETGKGPGVYGHPTPSVHGLWPETGSYGTSQCIAPSGSTANPTKVYSCYDVPGTDPSGQLSFEQHEWSKHGVCAAVKDADDFFDQICSLSAEPLQVVAAALKAGDDVSGASQKLTSAGYAVFATDPMGDAQIELSACCDSSGIWHLAAVSDFASTCGSGPAPRPGPSPGPGPGPPPPPPPATECARNTHGPPCSSDSDCDGVPNCVRCAHSGYCTDVPIEGELAARPAAGRAAMETARAVAMGRARSVEAAEAAA